MRDTVSSDRRERVADALWGATLLTLPWIGADLIILATGKDVGAGLQPSWLLMAACWLVAGPGRLRTALPPRWRLAVGAIAASVLLSAGGLALAPAGVALPVSFARYFRQVVQLAVMAAFALWPLAHVRGPSAWRATARWLVAGALLQAGYGLLQQVAYRQPLPLLAALERVFTSNPAILSGSRELYAGDRFLAVPRLRGTACEPLYLGNYLLLALPAIALTGWRPLVRGAAAATLALLLLLTWSRGAWLGALAGLALAGWWGLPAWRRGADGRAGVAPAARARKRRFALAAAGIVLLLAVAALAGWEPARLPARRLAQTFSRHDWSNLTRLYSLQAAWRAFLLSPLTGIGWGQFAYHFPALVDPAGLQAMFTWPVVANFPALVLCETGLPGFAALLVAAAGLGRGVAACRRRAAAGAPPAPAVGALACAGGAIAVQTMTFSQYNLPHAWVALGLLAAALLAERDADGEGPP
jgi:O-antigen ligase